MFYKKLKDQLIKKLLGAQSVPRGLFELQRYMRLYGPINFDYKESEGHFVAVSTNFNQGSIIAEGKTVQDLENSIPDAILTSFEVPSSYVNEAAVHKVDSKKEGYAFA